MSSASAQGTSKHSTYIYSSASSLSYSEASAVYQMYNNDWNDYPRTAGTQAFSRNHAALGLKYKNYSIEYRVRTDLSTRFSPDSAKLLYYYNHEKKVPDGQVFDIDLTARMETSEGARFSFTLPTFLNITVTPYFSVLKARELQQGSIQGTFSQPSNKDYVGQGEIHYYSSKDKIFKLPNHLYSDQSLPNPSGYVYSLDINLKWDYQNFHTDLWLEDAWYNSRWEIANQRDGEIDVNTQLEGLHTQASLKGTASRIRYNPGSMPMFSRLHSYYQWQHWQFGMGAWHYYGNTFAQASLAYQFNQHHRLGFTIEDKSHKATVSYQQQYQHSQLSFTLGSDRLNLRQAHALELGLTAALSF